MQITLEALEKAVAPIEELGQGESSFPVGNTMITVRVILPEEEAQVQNYAAQLEGDGSAPMEFIERFKRSLLSYAIVQFGALDLRDVTFVETGEKLDNGKFVKIPKVDAISTVIGKWSSPVRTGVYRKYVDLLSRVEEKSRLAIVFEPSDRDTEINRLEREIERMTERKGTLIEERDRKGVDLTSSVSRIAREIATREETLVDKLKIEEIEADQLESPKEPPVKVQAPMPPAVPAKRTSILPQQAAPPQPRPAQTPSQVPIVDPPQPKAGAESFDDIQDSFVDMGDPEGLEAAIAIENRRMLARRQHPGKDGVMAPESRINSVLARRPPHLDAQETERELEASMMYAGKTSTGVDTFRLPAEDLVERRGPAGNQARIPLNQGSPKGTNPRFKAPSRG